MVRDFGHVPPFCSVSLKPRHFGPPDAAKCLYTAVMTDAQKAGAAGWNAIADEWTAHADTNDYHNRFLLPMTLELIGDVSARRILDLGCGEGSYARALAGLGASVTGIDSSVRLVEVARERAAADHLPIEFICGDAADLGMFADASFDVVLAAMTLMSVSDYDSAIAESSRVLREDGVLWMSILHPCFSTPGAGWCRDPDGQPLHFGVDRYFDRMSWEEKVAERFSRPVTRYHRPLEDYVAAASRSGLLLRSLHEPRASDADLRQSARFWTLQRVPYFLLLRWQKRV